MRMGVIDRNSNHFFLRIFTKTYPFFHLFVLHMFPISPRLIKSRNVVRKWIESEKWAEKCEEGLMGG